MSAPEHLRAIEDVWAGLSPSGTYGDRERGREAFAALLSEMAREAFADVARPLSDSASPGVGGSGETR